MIIIEIFKMFGTIFLKDEASDKMDDIDNKGKRVSNSLSGLGKIALKASAGIAAIASASAGAVAASAPLLTLAGGLAASFGAAGIGVAAYGAVATSVLSGVFEKSEEIAALEEKLANADSAKERIAAQKELQAAMEGVSKEQKFAMEELNNFKSFWSGFTKQFEAPILNSFGTSMHILQELFKGLAPTISSVANVIDDLLTSMDQDISNGGLMGFFQWMETNAAEALYSFATIAGNVFSGLFGLLQAFSPIGASIEEGLVRLTEKFATWANTLSENPAFQNFIEYAKTNTPVLLDILSNLWTMITGAIETLAPLGTVILEILQKLTDTLISWTPMFQTIIQYITDFANLINNNWSTTVDVILALGAAVGSFLVIMKGLQIIGIINALMVAMRAGTLAATIAQLGFNAALWANPITWVVGLIALLVAAGVLLYRNWDVVSAKAKELGDVVAKAFNWLANEVKRYMKMAENNVKVVLDYMKNTFKNSMSFIKALVTGDFEGMVSAVKAQMGNILSTVQNIWGNVKSFLSGINLSDTGKNIIQGMINGIESMAGRLVSAAKGVVGDAINGAKALLGINSPSRVFMEIGEFTGQGMEIGLDKSKQGVENASKELAIVSARSASETQAKTSGVSSESTLMNKLIQLLENFKVDLHMDSNLVGSGVANTVSNRQGEQISRNKFFSGGDKR